MLSPGNNHALFDIWMIDEHLFDFFRLDAKTADLDLEIGTAEDVDVSVRQQTHQITGFVEPLVEPRLALRFGSRKDWK